MTGTFDTSTRQVYHLARFLDRSARSTRSAGRAAASHHDNIAADICDETADRYASTAATLRALAVERDTLRAALIRLRDCDWTRGPGDRMDAVRDIARAALGDAP
jgi:hypothetical protein